MSVYPDFHLYRAGTRLAIDGLEFGRKSNDNVTCWKVFAPIFGLIWFYGDEKFLYNVMA